MITNTKEAGIIGPSQTEITEFNRLRGLIRKSPVLTAAAAVLGIPAITLACAEQKPAEVRPVAASATTPEPSSLTATPIPTVKPTETSVPPTPTPTEIPKPTPTPEPISQQEALKMIGEMIGEIMNSIKNPDPELLKKYNIPPAFLEREQTIILYGGEDKSGTSGMPKTPDGHPYTPDSLAGLEAAIRNGDYTSARTLIKTMYRRVTNPNFRDDVLVRLSPEEALKLDPEKQFLAFPPSGQPAFLYSEVKGQETARGLVNLYYGLPPSGK